MEKLKDFISHPKFIFVILFFLILPTFISLMRPGFFPMQDDLQAFRIYEMDKCFADFQFPCRWVPDAGYQYGYPQFNYYPPFVYYLGEIIHLLGFQFIDAVKILFILGFIFSALTMFIFLNSWLKKWPALVGAVLYTYAPYKAVDVYVRGALSEFWAFVFFPLIFWSVYQLIKTEKIKYLIWMAISIGLLLTTHSLMSMIFLPIAGIWALLWIVLEKKWQVIIKPILGALLGIGLAAYFVLPMAIEKQYSHSESMLGGYFDYRAHFVDIQQLFLSNYWGYGSSQLGPGDDLSLSTGSLYFLVGLIAVLFSILNWKANKKIAVATVCLMGTDLFVLFMTHQKSSFIWERVGLLWWMQFPWRLLADSVFLLSVLSAVAVFLINKKKLSYFLGIILIFGVILLYGSFFKPQKWIDLTDTQKFSGNLWEKELTISIFDYLPIFAVLPPTNKAPEFPEVMDGKADFISYKKGSDFQEGEINVVEKANLRLPLFDFPGMVVKIDGKKVIHNHNDCRNQEFCLGLISFEVPEGKHKIEVSLTDTFVRSLGNFLTFLSFLVLIYLIVKERREVRGNDNN